LIRALNDNVPSEYVIGKIKIKNEIPLDEMNGAKV